MLEDVGTSANNILQLDSNAKIPAVDGSLLTGTDTALSGSSDPTISTNPTNGVGTKYKNTTSGEMYICTDATAGANVWTNVGEGTGDIVPWLFGGTIRGFAAGNESSNVIDSFSFASDLSAFKTLTAYPGTGIQADPYFVFCISIPVQLELIAQLVSVCHQ